MRKANEFEFAIRTYSNKAGTNIYLNKTINTLLGLGDFDETLNVTAKVILGNSIDEHKIELMFREEK